VEAALINASATADAIGVFLSFMNCSPLIGVCM
jgi:hypothetical protein